MGSDAKMSLKTLQDVAARIEHIDKERESWQLRYQEVSLDYELMKKSIIELLEKRIGMYPEDIFPDPPPGQHGDTVDTCSARAIRHVLNTLITDIKEFFDD